MGKEFKGGGDDREADELLCSLLFVNVGLWTIHFFTALIPVCRVNAETRDPRVL